MNICDVFTGCNRAKPPVEEHFVYATSDRTRLSQQSAETSQRDLRTARSARGMFDVNSTLRLMTI